MNTQRCCMTCSGLGQCTITDEQKVYSGFVCDDWKEASTVQVTARQQIVYKFGSAGYTALVELNRVKKEEEE